MRHPNGEPIDVDKAAFDATVAEVREAYGLLVDFFGALGLNVDQIWDFLFLIGRVGAAESIRVRWPIVHGSRGRPAWSGGLVSRDDVEGLNVLRAVDLLGGKSGAPSDVTRSQRARGPAQLGRTRQRDRTCDLWRRAAPARARRLQLRGVPGLEDADPRPDRPYRLHARRLEPASRGRRHRRAHQPHLDLRAGDERHAVQAALPAGGGISHTRGRFTASIEAPAAGSVVISKPWNFEAGDLLRAVAAYGRADAKALEFGEQDGPHLDGRDDPGAARAGADLVGAGRVQGDRRLPGALRRGQLHLLVEPGAEDAVRSRARLRPQRAPVRGRPEVFVLDGDARALTGGGLPACCQAAFGPVETTSGGLEANLPPSVTQFGPFRIQKGQVAIGDSPDGDRHTALELATSADIAIGPFNLTIDRIGMRLDLRAGGVEPNLGLVDMDFGFKPPNGIGLTIDAKAIKGGGFLYLDADKGEYAGVLELSFKGMTVKALGPAQHEGTGACRLVAAPDPLGGVPRHAVADRARLHHHGRRRHPRAPAHRLGRPAAGVARDERLRRRALPDRPGEERAAHPGPAAHAVPGPGARPHRRSDRRGQLADAAARRRAPRDSRAVHGRVRRRRVPLHPADRDRNGPGRGAARDGRRAAARRPHRRPPRRLRRRVGAARDRRAAARLEAGRGRVHRLADRQGRPRRQPGLRDRGGRLPPGVRRPAARAAGAGSTGSASSGRSATPSC